MKKELVEQIAKERGFGDFKWVAPKRDIVVAHWVRLHCRFGCNHYGKSGGCPPTVPSVEECRQIMDEYDAALLIHVPEPEEGRVGQRKRGVELYELERAVFLAGHQKAFLLQYGACCLCKECVANGERQNCVNKMQSRPGVDAMAVDMYTTARNAGYPIEVVKTREEMPNRYAILLVE
ncbi:MAG: DUF2284 domain-containing protein [Clostridiales Family XIII bacterium]|nr:DUF2284 domain-containing protein [Clostridiales Family XIII bacterium]